MTFRAISIRSTLFGLAILPLAIIALMGGYLAWTSYQQYVDLRQAMPVKELAEAGSQLALALPAEALSNENNRAAARSRTDAVFKQVLDAHEALKASGQTDPVIEETMRVIREGIAKVGPHRIRVDEGKAVFNEALYILQPVSAAGLRLMDRVSAIVSDLAIARFVAGFHALMQTNDASLIENNLGITFLRGETLAVPAFSYMIHSRSLMDIHRPALMDFLPADITQGIRSYETGPNGEVLKTARQDIFRNDQAARTTGITLDQWTAAKQAQYPVLRAAIEQTAGALDTLARTRLADARSAYLFYIALTAAVVLVVSALCVLAVRNISTSIRGIAGRMHALAEGDVENPIPLRDRGDEIGEMARSVEIFREAAVRNLHLEAENARQREAADRERQAMQAQAEADAEHRLNQATGSLAASLRRLAAGDLLCDIEERFAERFEPLRNDFNTSMRQLRTAMAEAARSASVVGGGSNEISQASGNLARRTEQQAAALEETAAALDQVTANVTATSRRTAEARDLVRSTRERAEQSSAVVRNAVGAMERIDQSARQITQIIGVIDEIAFQTSLLALNAGVEAARAGDAGRGFAVVAQEVRALAQRSAEAAKEIKGLISNSERTVGEGVQLVTDAGGSISAIEELMRSIDGHMNAIAGAASDQSNSLAEVNIAMNDMDKNTQQNAAMVQEVSASGDELRLESARLAEMLGRFRTGGTAADFRQAA
ncbi:methyl-accepting chemotaxis protein [Aquibium sp. ELW1220]|uniref:methyl-accepting chemotaxis protein n=1 Tax=Aquibium sp. ELW1220 TaxID=2976766 RepID=UPI0025AF446C|nr:methyl-accepting chemotaxis protein [Aquibium sp. ELW1220]MDN2579502.1 methyl-accepting chemotaxis protein [Aquibium sp. ELW1220]